jgi:hypothetical protein
MKYLLLILCINIFATLPDTIDTDEWRSDPRDFYRCESAFFRLTQIISVSNLDIAVFESNYYASLIMLPLKDITIQVHKGVALLYCVKIIVKIAEQNAPTSDGFGVKVTMYKVIKKR